MGSRGKIAAAVATVLLGGAASSGCGSSGSHSTADPAMLAPVSSPFYVSVAIEPQGGPHGNAVSDAQQLTHLSDPYGELAETLLATESSHPRFKQQIAPWVGRWAGIFLSAPPPGMGAAHRLGFGALSPGMLGSGMLGFGARSFGAHGAQGGMVLDTSDLAKARAFLAQRARAAHARALRYRGIALEVAPSGETEGVVDGFVAIGSESGVKAAIDSARGAASLRRAPDYRPPPADAIASAFFAPAQLDARGPGSTLPQLLAGVRDVAMTVTPGRNSLSLGGELHAGAHYTPLFAEQGGQVLGSLPAGAWLALGVGDLGASVSRLGALLGTRSAMGLTGAIGGIQSALSRLGAGGLEHLLSGLGSSPALRRNLARWAGPAGVYVSGSGLLELQAALVVDSREPGSPRAGGPRAAVQQVGGIARRAGVRVVRASIPGTEAAKALEIAGFPAVLDVAAAQSKLIVGLGQASVSGALQAGSTLAGSPSYANASAQLGEGIGPSLILEFPMLLSLLEAIGLDQTPPISSAVPYLRSLGTLVAGSASRSNATGTTTRFRAVLGLAGSSSGG